MLFGGGGGDKEKMELAQEEVMGPKGHTIIIKGRRGKRRPASPLALTMASSSSSAGEGGSGGGVSDNSGGYDRATASPTTTSAEFTESGEEEEDMANCLILLAQGQSRKLSKPAAATTSNAGFCVYQCKTCDRCFPSFQALGGHRASHKRPKAIMEEKKASSALMEEEEDQFNNNSTTLAPKFPNRVLCMSNNRSKVHECSVCGAEFSSGQALGGHMRRHRTFASATTTMTIATISSPDQSQEAKKPRNILPLDLNLPAPEEDHRESKFPFTSKEQVLVFSASPLVDCHY